MLRIEKQDNEHLLFAVGEANAELILHDFRTV